MFVNRSEERSWSELSTREIIVKTLLLWGIIGIFVLTTIGRGFQMLDMVVTGFVIFVGISVGSNAIGELNRRRKQQTTKDSNDDHV